MSEDYENCKAHKPLAQTATVSDSKNIFDKQVIDKQEQNLLQRNTQPEK